MVNIKIVELFCQSILKDEFDDLSQNDNIYGGAVSGFLTLERLMSSKSILASNFVSKNYEARLLNIGSGTSTGIFEINKFSEYKVFNLEPCPQRRDGKGIEGWAENIPKSAGLFDVILCWGTLCFVRSLPETLISFNKALFLGGKLVVDIVTSTVMPLAQTVDKDSFLRYVQLFGFTVEEQAPFVTCQHHKRVGLRLNKYENFDVARLRIPQCKGVINNYLEKRDFFLK